MRTMPRPAGYHIDRRTMVKRSDGLRACRFCKGAVKPPRRTFCSDPCVERWKFYTDPATFRETIFKRDNGICAVCGLDCKEYDPAWVERQLYLTDLAARRKGNDWQHWKETIVLQPDGSLWPREHWLDMMRRAYEWRAEHKIAPGQPPWQVDHIIEIADGGDWWALDNLQTVCVPHHRRKSAASATARAARRRQEQGAT